MNRSAMKKRSAFIICMSVIVSLTGCAEKSISTSVSSNGDEVYVDTEIPENIDNDTQDVDIGTLEDIDGNSQDNVVIEGSGYYDDCFNDFFYNTYSGPPMEYEDVMKMISNPDNGGLDSYYLIEINKALTLSECEELDGWFDIFGDYYEGTTDSELDANKDKVYFDDNTVYEVNIVKDLIKDVDMNETVYLLMKTGNPYIQVKGDPIYAPGEMLCAALKKPQMDCELKRTMGDFMLRFDVVVDDGGNYLAKNRSADSKLFPIGEEINETQITSTTANPVIYQKQVPLNELSDFLRDDWENRNAVN